LFVIEAPYLRDLVESVAYDTIYHEHVSYLSTTALSRIYPLAGLTLTHGERKHPARDMRHRSGRDSLHRRPQPPKAGSPGPRLPYPRRRPGTARARARRRTADPGVEHRRRSHGAGTRICRTRWTLPHPDPRAPLRRPA